MMPKANNVMHITDKAILKTTEAIPKHHELTEKVTAQARRQNDFTNQLAMMTNQHGEGMPDLNNKCDTMNNHYGEAMMDINKKFEAMDKHYGDQTGKIAYEVNTLTAKFNSINATIAPTVTDPWALWSALAGPTASAAGMDPTATAPQTFPSF